MKFKKKKKKKKKKELIYQINKFICVLIVSDAHSSLSCVRPAISGVMAPFKSLAANFLMLKS